MKKLITLTIALFLLFAGNVFGQIATDDITASATIESAGAVTAGDNLTFGNVERGSAGTVEIDGTGNADATNASTPQLGTFTITGAVGEQFAVSFNIPANLVGQTTAANLPFSMNGPNFGRVEGSDENNGNFNPDTGVDIQIADDGGPQPVTIKIGGEVTPSANQATEIYEGTITLNIDTTTI